MAKKMKIRRGDTVIVVAGSSKGISGEVLRCFPSDNKAIVKDVNLKYKHVKPSQVYPEGGVIPMEKPIDVSNLSLIDPVSGRKTKVGYRMAEGKNGIQKVRYAKRSGELLDKIVNG